MKSDNAKKGVARAPHRSLFYASGYTDEEFDDFLTDCYIDIEEVTDMEDLEGEDIIDLT